MIRKNEPLGKTLFLTNSNIQAVQETAVFKLSLKQKGTLFLDCFNDRVTPN